MMEAVRTWLTAVVLVSLLLSVAQSLIPEGTLRRAASFTGGLVLLFALLRPVLGADLGRLELDFDGYQAEIADRQEELAAAQTETLAELIAEETEAYIWDKAGELGVEVTARVSLEHWDPYGEEDGPVLHVTDLRKCEKPAEEVVQM